MTNCPNCGAPYAPEKMTCEYCGTVNYAEYELQREAQLERDSALIRFDMAQSRQFAALLETILSDERRRRSRICGY